MTRRTPAPDLIWGLPMIHEAPDQVRGGVSANLNTTLTTKPNSLQTLGYPLLSTVDTP